VTKFDPKSTAGRTAVHETTAAGTGMTQEEERVVRMRSGATVPNDTPLGSKLDGVAPEHREDVAARLRLIEAAALDFLARGEVPTDDDETAGAVDVVPVNGQRKARIVAAFKKISTEN
jgi:hypothetical protein